MFCHQCGFQLPEGARFCPSCGKRTLLSEAASPPPIEAPAEQVIDQAAEDTEGVATTASAPSSAAGEPASPEAPWQRPEPPAPDARPTTAPMRPLAWPELPRMAPEPEAASPQAGSQLPPLPAGALLGFAAAIAGTLFGWFRVSSGPQSESISGWDGEAQFRFADWLAVDAPIDALLLVLLAGLGISWLFGRLMGGAGAFPGGVPLAGGFITLVGVLNWLYIDNEADGLLAFDVNIAFGLYLVVFGGILAAVCGYLDAQQERRSQPAPA